MKTIKPELFWKVFAVELNKALKEERKWFDYYCDNKKWTKFIFKFLTNLSPKFGIEVTMREHWPKIDISYYDKPGDEWDMWASEVAIEHENDPKTWRVELCKLMLLNSGLKVLIAYRNITDRELDKELKDFIKIYKSRKYHQVNDSWILIFGPTADMYDKYDFVAYKFNGKNITKLEDIAIGREL